MYCESCGSFIADGQAFCSNCGASAPVASPASPAPGTAPAQPVYSQPVQPVYQQPVYQQPVYQQPVYQQPVAYQQPVIITQMPRERTRINGAATAGLIFGIISILVCWIPVVGFFPSLFGLTFSILGVARKRASGKGRAIAGLIMSGITFLIGICFILMLLSEEYSG